MELRERIARVVSEYGSQGWHRTGTDVDAQSGGWLAAQLEAAGVAATLEQHPFERLDPVDCRVVVGRRRIEGLPLFDGGLTGPGGVRGRIGPAGSSAEIGLVSVSPSGAGIELDEARREARHQALVAVTVGGRPGLAPRNAPSFAAPFGPPVLQVGTEAADALAAAAVQGLQVTVVVQAQRVATTACNVVGTVEGAEPGLAPVVVMTPRSGWWQCASERGGGIVCWLESARAVAAAHPRRTAIFLASTGHELGYWGLDQFLAARPSLAKNAFAWIHFGASIGAALVPRPFLYSSDDALERLLVGAMRAQDCPAAAVVPRGAVPPGESKNIHEAGGRYVSILGASALFHLEADRWPDAVDIDAVGRYARAFAGLVVEFANAPEPEGA